MIRNDKKRSEINSDHFWSDLIRFDLSRVLRAPSLDILYMLLWGDLNIYSVYFVTKLNGIPLIKDYKNRKQKTFLFQMVSTS